jgi:hypothetical protein
MRLLAAIAAVTLNGKLYVGPTWEGGENYIEFRRVSSGPAEPFLSFPLFTDIPVRGGFFYEIRVTWLYGCERIFSLEFSHPN